MKLFCSFLVCIALLRSQTVAPRKIRECAACHPAQAKPQPATSMAHALELVSECTILKTHPLLTFQDGKYSYRIERQGDQSIYSVSDGQQTFAVPIGWAFGLGSAGQTYVWEKDGKFYQSRVSYFRALDGLDFTLGALNRQPVKITEAAGEIMTLDEKLRCFGCHSTDAVAGRQLTIDKLIAGVQCERCHGPTTNHLDGVKQGNAQRAQMQDLRKFTSEEVSSFCGQCHRTWDEIAVAGRLGIADVRFQPYRLTNSKCYDPDDARIACTTCHDPHREVDKTDSDYDTKCQACHAGSKKAAHPCKVATSNCASCHMPKLEIPGSHFKFTDHQIRIVRANAPYPD